MASLCGIAARNAARVGQASEPGLMVTILFSLPLLARVEIIGKLPIGITSTRLETERF